MRIDMQKIVFASLPVCVLVLLGACTSSSTIGPETYDGELPVAETTVAETTVSETTEAESEAVTADEPVVFERPMRYQIDPSVPFPPPPPDGIRGISVPSYVVQPAATYVLAPSASAQELRALEVPEPLAKPVPSAGSGVGPAAQRSGNTAERNRSDRETVDGSGGRAELGRDTPGALGSPPAARIGSAPAGPDALTVATNFDSVDFEDNGTETGFFFIPPDPHAAAGPHKVVNVVNVLIAYHDKSTGSQDFMSTLAGFFSAESPTTFTFDPKVLFDQKAGRFVVVTLERDDTPDISKIFLAVSDDSDPAGTWYTTTIDAKENISGTDGWFDYPGFAVDEEAIYITGNMFGFASTGFPFLGVRLYVVERGLGMGGFYDGGTAIVHKFDPYASDGFELTTQPAHIYGVPAPGVGTWLVGHSGLHFSSGPNAGDEVVQAVRLDDPLGTPTFTLDFVNVGDISDEATGVPPAEQMDTAHLISTVGARAFDADWWNDRLWFTFTVNPKSPDVNNGQATAHWVEFDTSSGTVAALADQGNVDGETIAAGSDTYFLSLALNGSGHTGFGLSSSAPGASGTHPSSHYTQRHSSDPAGQTDNPGTVRSGTDWYRRTFQCSSVSRWGDYTGLAVDPVDGCFWAYNEYAILRGSATTDCEGDPSPDEDGRWGTAYGQFCPTGSCPIDMFLANESLGGTQTRSTGSSIRTGSGVVVASGADVTFEAPDLIAFGSGFTVEGDFTARITNSNPCSGS